ncbi:hypothetical protein E4U59_005755 [Claviceps monticola]|nr:hypothetical protein E4U59_005755 [Claviceps monticola]
MLYKRTCFFGLPRLENELSIYLIIAATFKRNTATDIAQRDLPLALRQRMKILIALSVACVASAAPDASFSRASMPLRLVLKAITSHFFLRRLIIELTSNIMGASFNAKLAEHSASCATSGDGGQQVRASFPAPSTPIDANDSFKFSLSARQYSQARGNIYDSTGSQ